jgi:hypothetical protein
MINKHPPSVSAMVVALAVLALAACSTDVAGYGDPVDGLQCDATGQEAIQAQVRLDLFSGQTHVPATSGIGSTGDCNYAVRTEQEEGIVIVRGEEAAGATLATFLTIWEYAIPDGSGWAVPFLQAATEGEIRVNGERVEGGPAAVPLRDGDVIELIGP